MDRSKPRGHFSRSRSLADFDAKFSPGALEKAARRAIRSADDPRAVRVLEIGCGEGRVLLELRRLFPGIELDGINRKRWSAMTGQESLAVAATYYKLFRKGELKKRDLPKIRFYDATKLRFPDNHLDVVYSQVAIPYFERKDILLEEVWRVLKPGGVALLHIDSHDEGYPDFLFGPTPRFIIYEKRGARRAVLPLKRFLSEFRKEGFDLHYVEKGGKRTLTMRKSTAQPLRLGLALRVRSSFDLMRIRTAENGHVFWGYRSVFKRAARAGRRSRSGRGDRRS